jgi:parallel beta-helix repeat protein
VITHSIRVANDLSCGVGPLGPNYTTALFIGASGITLDLNGHQLYGYPQAVLNRGHDGVTITGGEAVGEYEAVRLEEANRNRIAALNAWGVTGASFVLVGSDDNRIESNLVKNGQSPISLEGGSDRNLVQNNEITNSYGSVEIFDSSRNRVQNNDIFVFELPPVKLVRADRNSLMGNRIRRGAEPVTLEDSDDNLITRNAIGRSVYTTSYRPGLQLVGSSRNRLLQNTVTDNSPGVELVSGTRDVLDQNAAIHNGGDGFLVHAGAGAVLRSNTATGNADDGFNIESIEARLIHNTADDNGDLGIEAVPGVFAVGNRASGNGNPLQCLNVFCQRSSR